MSDRPQRDAYSLQEIAELTGLSLASIRREIAAGQLRAKQIRRRWIIPRRWYEEWLYRAETPPRPAIWPLRTRSAPPPPTTDTKYPWDEMHEQRQRAREERARERERQRQQRTKQSDTE